MDFSKTGNMVYVVIPVFNRLNYTIACLESLHNQHYKDLVIVVVDHGSTDGTGEYISRHFPQVVLLKGHEDMWWTAATNLGISYALEHNADFILTLNNDLVVRPDYVEALMQDESTSQNTIVGSVSVDIHHPEKVAFAGTKWNPWIASYRPAADLSMPYAKLLARISTIATDLLPGRGTLIPAAAFHKAGLFDDQQFPHYAADEDFSLRAKKMGYNLIVNLKAVVYSHVKETGLSGEKISWSFIIRSFRSVKSPKNLKIRWRWAMRHAKAPAPVYFLFDFARLLKSTLSR